MSRSSYKIHYMISTIFCVTFSIIFAAVVYSALKDEQKQDMMIYQQEEIKCGINSTFINVIVAIFLAAIFNSKKIIKMGTF
jgi:hypothetical protein